MKSSNVFHVLALMVLGCTSQSTSANRMDLVELELVTEEHRVVVRAAVPEEGGYYTTGMVEVALRNDPSVRETAELPGLFRRVIDARIVSDKLWVHGTSRKYKQTSMLIYRLAPLELLDRVLCYYGQILSPSGRFAVFPRRGGDRWVHGYPKTLLYDLWAEPDDNLFDGTKGLDRMSPYHMIFDAGRLIHPLDGHASPAYQHFSRFSRSATPSKSQAAADAGDYTDTSALAWSEDERLVAFLLYVRVKSVSPPIVRHSIEVIELDAAGLPVESYSIDVPDYFNHQGTYRIEFLGSLMRVQTRHSEPHSLFRRTWIPNTQPWMR